MTFGDPRYSLSNTQYSIPLKQIDDPEDSMLKGLMMKRSNMLKNQMQARDIKKEDLTTHERLYSLHSVKLRKREEAKQQIIKECKSLASSPRGGSSS